jgi:DUF3040 family protein
MVSPDEQQRLAGIERWFASNDPELAKTLEQGLPPRAKRPRRAITCLVTDLLGVTLFVAGALTSSLPVMAASMAVVVTTLCLHIAWLPDKP